MRFAERESERERRGGVMSSRELDVRCEGQGRVAEAEREEERDDGGSWAVEERDG